VARRACCATCKNAENATALTRRSGGINGRRCVGGWTDSQGVIGGSVTALRFPGATFGRVAAASPAPRTTQESNNRARFPATFGIPRFLTIVNSAGAAGGWPLTEGLRPDRAPLRAQGSRSVATAGIGLLGNGLRPVGRFRRPAEDQATDTSR
jgi:hypothetical protein